MTTTTPTLAGARVLVVGASAGIGEAFARSAALAGAEVCVSARRLEKLESLREELGSGHAIAGDATDADDCTTIADTAAERMGGIDLVLYTAGTAVLGALADVGEDAWRRSYEVNVLGPAMVARAALPHLSESGVIAFLSSEATHEFRWGMGTYAASKAALDTAIRYWRYENPHRRFSRVVIGATMPTEFGLNFEPEPLTEALQKWASAGIEMTAMDTREVGLHLAELFGVVLAHPEIDLPDLYLDARLAGEMPPVPGIDIPRPPPS